MPFTYGTNNVLLRGAGGFLDGWPSVGVFAGGLRCQRQEHLVLAMGVAREGGGCRG